MRDTSLAASPLSRASLLSGASFLSICAVLFWGCIDRETADLTGKACPCIEGFQCVDNVCVRGGGGSGGIDSGAAADSGSTSSDAGNPGSDSGTTDSGGTDAGVVGSSVCVEAEDGTISAPMETQANGDASGGSVVAAAAGTATLTTEPGDMDMGRVTLDLTVDDDGTYRVWGRVLTPAAANDSFWVRVDGGAWNRWNTIPAAATFQWDQVHNEEMGALTEQEFMLTSGAHTIDVHYREEGALLDKVLVTNDPALVPTGDGCP